MKRATTIGEYLIQQLHAGGVRHVFGIPGDYVLGFYDQLAKSKLVRVINTCDEQGAGFAADAYARVRGLGAVCVTYCVGGLKVANTTAGAFAEKSPVVIISGAPGLKEREKNPLLHHKVREFDTQKKVFEQLTVASTVLSDPQTAFQEIDRVLHAALRYKRPVYIELPRDLVFTPGIPHHHPAELHEESDPETLRAALAEAEAMINRARRPVILADVEVHRFALQDTLLKLVRNTNIPVATTVLGKSVIGEQHPFYLGVYEGALGRDDVRRYVEGSDCVIMLGAFLTDINLGVFTAQLDPLRTLYANSEKLSIRYHTYENVRFKDFMRGLLKLRLRHRALGKIPRPPAVGKFRVKRGDAKITVKRLFQRLNDFLSADTVVVADVGDALFGAADLFIRHRTDFLGPAYYASMGFAVPASVGAQLANPKLRPLVLVGDGAFQMTGLELSTVARYGLNPVVIVLNNFGYGTERPMQDGPFNDVLPWNYSRVTELLGAGRGFVVETEAQLDDALKQAKAWDKSFCLLEVRLDPDDRSPALLRLANRLGQRLSKAGGRAK
jgi:TPP-dependent 2-oxoacid decarboxylase